MDLLLPVFQLIYFVVHFLYSLGQAVLDCFHELYFLLCRFRRKKHFVPDSKRLVEDATKLKKLPRHLGLIFNKNQTNGFKNVCFLINWSVGFGIHNITFYDFEGDLKLKLPSLLDNLVNICVDVNVRVVVDGQVYQCNSISTSQQVHKRNSKAIYNGVNYSKNITSENGSYSKGSYITLNIQSVEDGKDDIVSMVKSACEKKILNLDSSYISSNLTTKNVIDPDLVIVLGRPICTLGFLPWQIRLTEFINIPSSSRLDYFEFRKVLQIYSKCEQRLGS